MALPNPFLIHDKEPPTAKKWRLRTSGGTEILYCHHIIEVQPLLKSLITINNNEFEYINTCSGFFSLARLPVSDCEIGSAGSYSAVLVISSDDVLRYFTSKLLL